MNLIEYSLISSVADSLGITVESLLEQISLEEAAVLNLAASKLNLSNINEVITVLQESEMSVLQLYEFLQVSEEKNIPLNEVTWDDVNSRSPMSRVRQALNEVDVSNKIWKGQRGGGRDHFQQRRWDRAQSNMLHKAHQLGDVGSRNVNDPPKKHDPATQKKIDALNNKSQQIRTRRNMRYNYI